MEEISKSAHRMGELVGLALRGTSDCPMELNLRPARVVRRHQLAEKRPFLIIAGLCAILAMVAWWLYLLQGTEMLNAAKVQLEPKVTELQNYKKKIDKARSEIVAEQDTAQPFLTAVDERGYWVQLLDDINSRLPTQFVWVTNFDMKNPAPEKGGSAPPQRPSGPPGQQQGAGGRPAPGLRLVLKGLYLSNPRNALVVDDFVNKLSDSKLYSVDKPGIKRSVPNEQEWAYDFEIPLILNNPISTVSRPASKNELGQSKQIPHRLYHLHGDRARGSGLRSIRGEQRLRRRRGWL